MVLFKMKFWTYLQGGMVYFDNLFDMYNITNTFQEQIIRSVTGEGAVEKDIEFYTWTNKFSRTVFLRLVSMKNGQFEHLGRKFV